MSEKEDLMALAFMIGGEINNIKQTANDRSRFVSEGLPNPKDFVIGVAKQDINKAVQQSKQQTIAIQNQLAKDNPTIQQNVQPNNVVSNQNPQISNDLLNQIVNELKITNSLLSRFAARAGV